MRVTVCQVDPRPEPLDASMNAVGAHLAEHESDLLLLPEMAFSDWLAAELPADPERWADSVRRHLEWIGGLESLGVDVVLGSRPIVDATGSRRNEAFVWTTENPHPVPIRQKYYLPDEPGFWEESWYDRGPRRFDTAQVGDARVGILMCTEMWFLEWARHYAAEGIDILATPRATGRGSIDKWVAGGRVAAVCSGAYALSSNLVVPEATSQAECGGVGWIIDPEGVVLATTSEEQPYATVEIDLTFARHSKTTYPRYVRE